MIIDGEHRIISVLHTQFASMMTRKGMAFKGSLNQHEIEDQIMHLVQSTFNIKVQNNTLHSVYSYATSDRYMVKTMQANSYAMTLIIVW